MNFKWHNVVVLEDVVVICKGYYCWLLAELAAQPRHHWWNWLVRVTGLLPLTTTQHGLSVVYTAITSD